MNSMGIENDRHTSLDSRLDEFEQVLNENPDHVPTLSAYGEAALLRGRLLEAMKSYQRLAALHPDVVEYQLALGKVYLDSGLVSEAIGVVRQVLETTPTSVEGHILLRRLSKANGSVGSDVTQSISQQDFLPPLAELSAERGKLERELAQLEVEVREHEGAVESAPGDPVVEFSMKMAGVRRDRVAEALAEVERWEGRHRVLEEEQRRIEEEERSRLAAEERERMEAEEAERRRIEDEERARREAEEADRRRIEEEERIRREAEEAERRRIEDEERARQEAEEAERRRIEEEERARAEAEEAERRRIEDEERARLEAEEAEALRGTREREAAYAALAPALSTVSGVLMKTKGVTAVLVMARDGFRVHESHNQDVDLAHFTTFVVDALAALGSPGDELGRWGSLFLEFTKGIVVLHRITADYYLVVLGGTGANFGVLTWTIDKNKGQLEGGLAGAPPVAG